MQKDKFEKNITALVIAWMIVGIFWFRADLGEGYNIGYFAIFAFIVGIELGTKIKFKK